MFPLAALALAASMADSQEEVPHPPRSTLFLPLASGVYASEQSLWVEALEPRVDVRYSIRGPDGAEGPWIPLRERVALTAAAGEEREYRIAVRAERDGVELERRELWFRIDKRPPAPPIASPAQGTYWDPVAVTFERGKGDKVFYTIKGDLFGSPTEWDGKPFTIGKANERSEYAVQAFSEDQSGNRSRIASFTYVIDGRQPALDFLSPVTGTFANPQAVALTFRNVQWVRYTIDGSDPVANGTPYVGPVLVRKQGPVTVRAAALPRGSSRPVIRREASFTWTPEPGAGLVLDMESGTYSKDIAPRVLSAFDGSIYYSLWEKTPSASDWIVTGAIPISAPAARRAVTLRLRRLADDGRWGAEYRFFYFLCRSAPTPPLVSVQEREPLRGPAVIEITGGEDALVRATFDGTAPGVTTPLVSGPLPIRLPPGEKAGSISVKALAFDGTGLSSPVTERRILYDTAAGPKPVLSAAQAPGRTGALVSVTGSAGQDFAFEITSDGTTPPAPTSSSPVFRPPFAITVPFGMERAFRIVCASLDEFGRLLTPSDSLAVTVDRKPPVRPALSPPPAALAFDEPLKVTLASEGKVFLSLTSDGSSPPDPTSASPAVSGGIDLPGKTGSTVTYKLKLSSIDDAGNLTEVYGPFIYTVDLSEPRLPSISGIKDGGRYNTRKISPLLGESPWKVLYTAAAGGAAPADPDENSPEFTGATEFTGDDGNERAFRVKLLAVSRNGKRRGEMKEISFIIDLKPPEVPEISGIVDGGRYARPVSVVSEMIGEDTRLYISVSTAGQDPKDPVAEGIPYQGPVVFDAPEGTQKDFAIRTASVDAAGNRSQYDRRYRFSIDRQPPDDPEIQGAPENGLSIRPVAITISSREGSVYYELTVDGSPPPPPTEKSPRYSSPLLFPGRSGVAITYKISARAVDELGNASRGWAISTVTVDRTVPARPAEPEIFFSPENPGTAYLSWEVPASGRLMYRLKSSLEGSGTFLPYSHPVSVARADSPDATIAGEAYLESPAGNRGETTSFAKKIGLRSRPPVVKGARDGGVYNARVELGLESASPAAVLRALPDPAAVLRASPDQVRYEIATDGLFPPSVTVSSPVAPQPLVLDVADGETSSFRVAARSFDPTGEALPSEMVMLGFVIDRTPPDPPSAIGIDDGGYYEEGRKVSLLSAEGTIYFSRGSPAAAAGIPPRTEANRYRSEISLEAAPGRTVSYGITAYTVDEAGNRSREVSSWSVTIDQKIVYVSSDGNDFADGTRGSPVRGLARALAIASTTPRKTLYVSIGNYPVDTQVTVSGDISIVAGLDSATWGSAGLGRLSVLTSTAPWRSGESLLAITSGKVSISGLELRDDAHVFQNLATVWDGEVFLGSLVMMLRDTENVRGLLVRGGKVTLANVQLRASGVKSGSLLSSSGGRLTVSGTEFAGPDSAVEFTCLEISDTPDVSLKGITMAPGTGVKTRGILVSRSRVSISASRIRSGAGSAMAVGLEARESDVEMENTELSADAMARSPIAILAVDTTLTVSKSRIETAGLASAIGISARGGELALSRSSIRAEPASEYVYLLRAEEGKALVSNSLLIGATAGESVSILLANCRADLWGNTVISGNGSVLTSAVLVQGDQVPRMVNNIIIRGDGGSRSTAVSYGAGGRDQGSAISILGARIPVGVAGLSVDSQKPLSTQPVILTNDFAGWEKILHVDYARETSAATRSAAAALDSRDVGTVESLNAIDGDIFGGSVHGNFTENPRKTFRASKTEDFVPAESSRCVDGGTDLGDPAGPAGSGPPEVVHGAEISLDLNGTRRPAPRISPRAGPPPAWDVGAFEYSE